MTVLEKKALAKQKLARIPIKIQKTTNPLPKPDWIKVSLPNHNQVQELKNKFKNNKLVTVCEEASCPNIYECFSNKTASFMIMGDKCTRRCSFCDVAHGRPEALDTTEPENLAQTCLDLNLNYVVITSVDRDDLRDGGAGHFANCIREIRLKNNNIKIEILVPDFRGRLEKALEILASTPCDVFNHNLETAPSLYKQARPGSDYQHSLNLLKQHKQKLPHIPTKSGLMLGLGETDQEVIQVMQDMRAHQIDMLTLGQYLQPTEYHLPVTRYVTPEQFAEFKKIGLEMGFTHVASGPMVRSSYHADQSARDASIID